ncbi:hypothetical protein ElyMa_003802500 [Elysia marginata]|uniref:Uncharacterized protein n=1 Tax=Elysia marginata TaxID=1093978 RepID=A0AAV4FCD3_9GAST|nr:hypothetical protein ElyMa_003802500 [Elysia marginata]
MEQKALWRRLAKPLLRHGTFPGTSLSPQCHTAWRRLKSDRQDGGKQVVLTKQHLIPPKRSQQGGKNPRSCLRDSRGKNPALHIQTSAIEQEP